MITCKVHCFHRDQDPRYSQYNFCCRCPANMKPDPSLTYEERMHGLHDGLRGNVHDTLFGPPFDIAER